MTDNENLQNPNVTEEGQGASGQQDYLDAYMELKKNSVSKEEYDRVVGENKKLFKTLTDGGQVVNKVESKKRPYAEVAKDMLNKNLNDLQYAKLFLELRDAYKEQTGDDFVSQHQDADIVEQDTKDMELYADILKDSIERANGDLKIFKAYYDSRVAETNLPRRR